MFLILTVLPRTRTDTFLSGRDDKHFSFFVFFFFLSVRLSSFAMMHPRRKLLPAFLLCFLVISMLVFIYLLKDKGGNRITEAQVMEIFGGRILNKSGELLCTDQKCRQRNQTQRPRERKRKANRQLGIDRQTDRSQSDRQKYLTGRRTGNFWTFNSLIP